MSNKQDIEDIQLIDIDFKTSIYKGDLLDYAFLRVRFFMKNHFPFFLFDDTGSGFCPLLIALRGEMKGR
jgi:hypothetical protein